MMRLVSACESAFVDFRHRPVVMYANEPLSGWKNKPLGAVKSALSHGDRDKLVSQRLNFELQYLCRFLTDRAKICCVGKLKSSSFPQCNFYRKKLRFKKSSVVPINGPECVWHHGHTWANLGQMYLHKFYKISKNVNMGISFEKMRKNWGHHDV